MKLQKATNKGKKPEIFLTTRITPALKNRLNDYAKQIDRAPAWVVRAAVVEMLDNADKKAA